MKIVLRRVNPGQVLKIRQVIRKSVGIPADEAEDRIEVHTCGSLVERVEVTVVREPEDQFSDAIIAHKIISDLALHCDLRSTVAHRVLENAVQQRDILGLNWWV